VRLRENKRLATRSSGDNKYTTRPCTRRGGEAAVHAAKICQRGIDLKPTHTTSKVLPRLHQPLGNFCPSLQLPASFCSQGMKSRERRNSSHPVSSISKGPVMIHLVWTVCAVPTCLFVNSPFLCEGQQITPPCWPEERTKTCALCRDVRAKEPNDASSQNVKRALSRSMPSRLCPCLSVRVPSITPAKTGVRVHRDA